MNENTTPKLDSTSPTIELIENPFIEDFPEYIERIRRNLLIFGFIATAYTLSGVIILDSGNIGGVGFKNLTPMVINIILLILTTYHLSHFVWSAGNHLAKWRLKLSGLNGRVTLSEFPAGKKTTDLKETTLYTWWLKQAEIINGQLEWFRGAKADFESLEKVIYDQSKITEPHQSEYLSKKISDIDRRMTHLITHPVLPAKIDENEIDQRLKRFDKWFWGYQRSAIWRWILVEAGLPIALGLFGFVLLLSKIIITV